MKTIYLIIFLIVMAMLNTYAQVKPTKKDSLKFSDTEVGTIDRNLLIIQQTIHRLDMSSLLRDKLDSVYNQSRTIIQDRVKGNNFKKKP